MTEPWANRIVGHGDEAPDQLLAHPLNARRHPGGQRDALRESLSTVGWVAPILVSQNSGRVIDGHARIEEALSRHEPTVPVTYLNLTDDEERYVLAVLDPISSMEDTDPDMLRELLDGIEIGTDSLREVMDGLMSPAPVHLDPENPPDADNVPDKAPAITVAGDVWLLGRHRIMCGDCRVSTDVEKLLDGATINLAVTSPPYAEQRTYDESSGFKPIPPSEYVEWFHPVADNVAAHLAADGSWFVNIKPPGHDLDTDLYVFDLVIAHAREWGWHFATEFCWERNGVPKSVSLRFKNQYEPVYQFTRDRWKMRPDAVRHWSENVPINVGPGGGNTSWSDAHGDGGGAFGTPRKSNRSAADLQGSGSHNAVGDTRGGADHADDFVTPGMAYPGNRLPTFAGTHTATGHTAAFPVGLPAFFVKAYTDPDDTVYDPFMGSGSTLIAAHQEGRIGYGMELSPGYVDIICRRYQELTGDKPIAESSGQPHDFTIQEVPQ